MTSRVLSVVLGLAAIALSAAGGAGAVSWLYWSPRYDLAAQRATTAEGWSKVHEASAKTCASNLQLQNDGITSLADTLKQAIDQANAASLAAKKERATYEDRAAAILSEKTPAGQNACAAASAAFDAELRKERGQ